MSEERDLFGMLRSEHDFIESLLGRLRLLAERLRDGEEVAPETMRRGVALLDAYLHRVHMHQFDVELWPEAWAAARPECRGALDRVSGDHDRMRRSARKIIELVRAWKRGAANHRPEIAERVLALVASDSATNAFEEARPFRCLDPALPATARARVGESFARHARTKAALEGHISAFVRGPIVSPAPRAATESWPPMAPVGSPSPAHPVVFPTDAEWRGSRVELPLTR